MIRITKFIKAAGFTIILMATIFSCAQKKDTSQKPNIIYILADDLGYAELGVYGQEKIETPNIDKLAATGMLFTQHYSGAPVCAPSRSVLLTGKHSGHTRIRGNDEWDSRGDVWNYMAMLKDSTLEGQRPMLPGTVTIGSLLQQAGYKTGLIGKWGLGAPHTEGIPTKQGFDFFYGYNCQRQAHTYYPTHLYKNENREYLDNDIVPPHTSLDVGADPLDTENYNKFNLNEYAPDLMFAELTGFIEDNKEQPFFLYWATPIPHVPLQAPKKWVDKYLDKFGDEEEPYTGNESQYPYFPNRYPHATYAAMVSYLDNHVGQLVQQLKDLGLYENTLIIFTSDNGPTYAGGADSKWFNSGKPFKIDRGWAKGYTHEGGIRVPMIASWPTKIKPKTTTNHISAFWDVLPTLCDIAGVKTNYSTDGISFYPTLVSDSLQMEHEFLYWEFSAYNGQQAVRMGKWKGLRLNMQEGNMDIELFNLEEDPREQNNLAEKHPKIVNKIAEIMAAEHETPEIKSFYIKGIDPM
ncbi:MAG: arylsulfatase [Cyclobacteriaceae bacterium]|nr:arylsulfatase [Cyclobacteriaceae bacterium]